MPRVTVIIPTYNYASVLPYSIGSVLDQTYRDFECFVIGDGCTDESGTVVGKIDDPRVHWHNLAVNTAHQSGPNNEGLRRASGDVIAYLGHDDLWLPRHLEVLVGAIDDGARLAHATTIFVEPDRRPTQFPTRDWSYATNAWIPPTTMAHDRDVARVIGGWRTPSETGTVDAETDLWNRIGAATDPPRWVRRVTSVKLPAALRRDVYRDRPYVEQASWLGRIRASGDPERDFTAAYPDRRPFSERALAKARSTIALRTRLRRAGVLGAAHEQTAESRRLEGRKYKGLEER
jgi:glycosyltransferase involved in cell wall biosynthesis